MPRFYLHIRDGEILIKDPEGSELPSVEAARAEAREAVREIVADRIRSGVLVTRVEIDICNETGEAQTTVALHVIGKT
jgi:hypothetical protein